MVKIGLLSDTHGFLHQEIPVFFKEVDEIWHAGDIGDLQIIRKLENIAPVRGVYGNIDHTEIRNRFSEDNIFTVEEAKIYMTHIGGYPGQYNPRARKVIDRETPLLFISGHSHILKVMNDKKRQILHMNPGAAGKSGLHKKITALRFEINKGRFENLEVFETPRKGV